MMVKKSIAILASFMCILVLALSGCGSSSSSGGKNTTITIWATNINVPLLKKAAATYKKDHPNFNVKVVEMANDDIRSKFTTGLQAQGQGLPDAALLVDDGINGYLEKFPNAFVNISSKGFEKKYAKDFPKYKLDSVTYKGDLYALPFDAGPVGLFYRQDIFEKAGVDPNSIKTWDDYIEAGKTIKAKTGVDMLSYDNTDITVYTILLSQQGLGYFDKNGNANLGTSESIKAAQLLQDMANNKILLGASGWNAWVSSLQNSKTATAIAGAWLVGTLEQQMPKLSGKWRVMNLPAFEEGGSRSANQGGSSFVISKSSKNIDATYNFLKYFTTNYNAQELAMKGGLFPSYLPVYKSSLFTQPEKYFGNQKVWTFFSGEMKKIPSVLYTANDAVGRDEAINMQAEIVRGKDVKTSVNAAKKRVENHVQ
ncbi:ABC transporter substrate-binding protein [Weizmannia acidilactici]|uniref:ABC transporter substrate-binding protein n=1 Tax=Weizmannia acidilactici TaxID=2607726 RepID=A0A5J4JEH7_9BACI|nr:ABC transporter substrate-binding protein [Weizmannia acidilactici]GER69809.1 ABC transporter substrate-binding protein [Weizmannia acidilactici]GER73673.1 ABC transporter substrate-binding protein [Weizmannia acidilactici]